MTTLITSKLIELSSDGGARIFTPHLLGNFFLLGICVFDTFVCEHTHCLGVKCVCKDAFYGEKCQFRGKMINFIVFLRCYRGKKSSIVTFVHTYTNAVENITSCMGQLFKVELT